MVSFSPALVYLLVSVKGTLVQEALWKLTVVIGQHGPLWGRCVSVLGPKFYQGPKLTKNISSSQNRVVHFHSSSLSLPLSPVISILATLLPILGFLNAYIHPSLLRVAHAPTSSRLRRLAPLVLQTLQALLTTILATLLFEGIIPSPALNCVLENDWMRMYRNHDDTRIRRIQDMMNCCGFNSVKDRAYPFRSGPGSQCAEMFGRTEACRKPWTAALRSSSGADFAVAIAVGLLQVCKE